MQGALNMRRGLVLAMLLSVTDAQRGSKFRCRDKEPKCSEWATTGECEKPRLHGRAMPSSMQLLRRTQASSRRLRAGSLTSCARTTRAHRTWRSNPARSAGQQRSCRLAASSAAVDNMTSCATIAQDGLCEKKDVASVVRFQCPQSCRRVQGTLSPTEPSYPRHKCAHEEGDAPSHKDHCGGWASSGECAQLAFMKLSCEFSCGLCSLDGSTPAEYRKILKPPAKTTSGGAKKKKKKVKKSVGTAAAEANTDTAEGGTTRRAFPQRQRWSRWRRRELRRNRSASAKEEAPKKKKAVEASCEG